MININFQPLCIKIARKLKSEQYRSNTRAIEGYTLAIQKFHTHLIILFQHILEKIGDTRTLRKQYDGNTRVLR